MINIYAAILAGVLMSTPLDPGLIKTPSQLSIWFQKNYTYQSDGEKDTWKRPKQTIKDKGGDCEDFAFLVDKIVSQRGYLAHVRALWWADSGHAVCIIVDNGEYRLFSNEYYRLRGFDTIRKLLDYYYPQWEATARIYPGKLRGIMTENKKNLEK